MTTRNATWFIGVLLAASVAVADDTNASLSTLTPGDQVRLRPAGSGKTLRAAVESVTADELIVRPQGVAEPLHLSLTQLHSLEVVRGQSSEWRKGAVIGFVPGALVFGLVGGVVACDIGDDHCFSFGSAAAGVLIGGVVTGSIGALVGLAFKTDRWVKVDGRKPQVSLMLSPARGQVRVGLSVTF
ncbi:MAG: DUF6232 family protein [Vicinamibacteria bacterium]